MTARSPTMVTLHDSRCFECRWWNDGWTVKTVVTGRSSASMTPVPGFHSRLPRVFFPRASRTRDCRTGIAIAVLPDTWRYRVSAGTGWFGVSILWLGEIGSVICSFSQ